MLDRGAKTDRLHMHKFTGVGINRALLYKPKPPKSTYVDEMIEAFKQISIFQANFSFQAYFTHSRQLQPFKLKAT